MLIDQVMGAQSVWRLNPGLGIGLGLKVRTLRSPDPRSILGRACGGNMTGLFRAELYYIA